MRLFAKLYDKVMTWVKHPKAPYYLGFLSFTEASFFPIPPDVMLAPMVLAQPKKAWLFALITTLSSVIGAILGYVLGLFFISLIFPIITEFGYLVRYHQAENWFTEWGFWALFVAGFTPIPYKLFTISAGALHMALLPFVVASLIGRALRFFLVAMLMRVGGAHFERYLRQHIDAIGWFVLIVVVAMYFILS